MSGTHESICSQCREPKQRGLCVNPKCWVDSNPKERPLLVAFVERMTNIRKTIPKWMLEQ